MHEKPPPFFDALMIISTILLTVLVAAGLLTFIGAVMEKDRLLAELGHEEATGFLAGANPTFLTVWKWGWLIWLGLTLFTIVLVSVTNSVRHQITAALSQTAPPTVPSGAPTPPVA